MPQQANPAPIPKSVGWAFDCISSSDTQLRYCTWISKTAHLEPSSQQWQLLSATSKRIAILNRVGNIFTVYRSLGPSTFPSDAWQLQLLRARYFMSLACVHLADVQSDGALLPVQKQAIKNAMGMARALCRDLDKMVRAWVGPFHHSEFKRWVILEAENTRIDAEEEVLKARKFAQRMAWAN